LEPYSNSASGEVALIGALTAAPIGQPSSNHEVPDGALRSAGLEIIRATRTWIQYGVVGFALLCIVIGAVEALFGR